MGSFCPLLTGDSNRPHDTNINDGHQNNNSTNVIVKNNEISNGIDNTKEHININDTSIIENKSPTDNNSKTNKISEKINQDNQDKAPNNLQKEENILRVLLQYKFYNENIKLKSKIKELNQTINEYANKILNLNKEIDKKKKR